MERALTAAPDQAGRGTREALLPFTLRNAARLDFYRDLWRNHDYASIIEIADLARLPTLTKAAYALGLMWHPQATSEAAYCTHSTGTTGTLTWRHRSHAEVLIMNKVLGPGRDERQGGLVLALRYPRHGMSVPLGSESPVIPGGVNDDTELSQVVEMLGASLWISGARRQVTTIAGQAQDVALIGQALLERGKVDDLGRKVERVVLGGRVSTTVASVVALAFPAAVQIERYSLSEVFGGASRVAPAPFLRLDAHVIGEVVAPDGSPVGAGCPGELTLTELYPLVQLQPLVRYRTGDVVESVQSGDLHKDGFRWLGRDLDCLPSAYGWQFRYSVLLDRLACCPIVARNSHRSHLKSVRSLDVAEPCLLATQHTDGRGVDLLVGLRVNPWFATGGIEDLVSFLWPTLAEVLLGPAAAEPVRLGFVHLREPSVGFNLTDFGGIRWSSHALVSQNPPRFGGSDEP